MFTGPVQQSVASTGGAFRSAPGSPVNSNNNLLTGGSTSLAGTGKPTFSYTGSGKGAYKQECSYKYVGPSEGEFQRVDRREWRRNQTLVCGFVTAAAVVGVLYYLSLPTATTTTTAGTQVSDNGNVPGLAATAPPGEFNCDMQAIVAGERVQAGADISFTPAGSVPEGTYGTVAEDAPSTDDKAIVVVTFDGYPQLAKARVTRNLIFKAVDVGDTVEAVMDVRYTPHGDIHEAPLVVTDLVRANSDIGNIKQGTYGTLVSNGAGDTVIVKFAGSAQLSTIKVPRSRISKASQVGDHVQALGDLSCGDGAAVASGAFGSVVTMEPVEDSFTYVVKWQGLASNCEGVLGASVKAVAGPVGRETIPQGTKGKVTQMLAIDGNAQYDYIVTWDGYPGSSARVDRDAIIKVQTWDKAQSQWCCDNKGVGCQPEPEKSEAPSTSAAPKQTTTEPDQYNCFAEGTWTDDQAKWCCDVKGFGCAFTTTAKPQVALYRCSGSQEEIQGWTDAKANWCCTKEGLGCRNGEYLQQG